MEKPGRLQSMGSLESNSTERLHFHFLLSCIGEGNGNPLQCSCLENPRDRGAWWAAVYGVAQSRTRLKRLSSSTLLWLIACSYFWPMFPFGYSCLSLLLVYMNSLYICWISILGLLTILQILSSRSKEQIPTQQSCPVIEWKRSCLEVVQSLIWEESGASTCAFFFHMNIVYQFGAHQTVW